jgi:hypothetical protein
MEHLNWAESFIKASDGCLLSFADESLHGGEVQANAAKLKRLMERALSGEISTQRDVEKRMLNQGKIAKSMLLRASRLNTTEVEEAIRHLVDLGDISSGTYPIQYPTGQSRSVPWVMLCS